MELLEEAYLAPDAIEALERLLAKNPTRRNVDWLVGDSQDPDVETYRQTREDPCSDIGWRSRFIYFANSLNHMSLKTLRVSMAKQKPYVWLDIADTWSPSCIRFIKQGRMPKSSLKVIVYAVLGKLPDMETIKSSVDLVAGQVIPCSRGSFVQISMTSQRVELVRPHPRLDCYIVLTRNGNFEGVYHKKRERVDVILH